MEATPIEASKGVGPNGTSGRPEASACLTALEAAGWVVVRELLDLFVEGAEMWNDHNGQNFDDWLPRARAALEAFRALSAAPKATS